MSECSCVSGAGENEFLISDGSEFIVSAQEHVCIECGRKIKPGVAYEHAWLVEADCTTCKRADKCTAYDTGQPYDCGHPTHIYIFQTCPECAELRSAFFCMGGWEYGRCWQQLAQYFVRTDTGLFCLDDFTSEDLEIWERCIEPWLEKLAA